MKWRASTKIAIGFVLIVGSAYIGWKTITDRMILSERFKPIAPRRVNIVGIDPGAGFKIIVSNHAAQLAETSGSFGADSSSASDSGDEGGSIKAKIPLRDMLKALQGDEKAMGAFVMSLNDMKDDSLPPERVYWKAEELRKALDGDPKLDRKLTEDLNVSLDGTPLNSLRVSALTDGIVIDAPVSVRTQVADVQRDVVGRVLIGFTPNFLKAVMGELTKSDKFWDKNMAAGVYGRLAIQLRQDPKSKENVRKALEGLISKEWLQNLAESPERVLRSAQVIVNDSLIESASYNTYASNRGDRLSNVDIQLSDEGRRRLWQYSKRRPNTQILVITDGMAIAAPRIRHELAQSNLTITQVPDATLVKEMVGIINDKQGKVSKR